MSYPALLLDIMYTSVLEIYTKVVIVVIYLMNSSTAYNHIKLQTKVSICNMIQWIVNCK